MNRVRGRVVHEGAGRGGVIASDGRSVVRTSADGSFELDAAGPYVFVSTPSGFAADRWYLPSDGELRFELRSDAQPASFSFAHISDLHLAFDGWVFGEPSAATPDVIADTIGEIVSKHPQLAFIVCTGDQTNNGTEDEFIAYLEIAAQVPLRIVTIPGNHDHNSVDPAHPFPTPYDRHLGPRWFSFDYGGVHFVAIDWTTYHMGQEVQVQEDWVRADLASVDAATPVFFLTHDLMQTAFFDRVGASPVASFSGHWHTSRVVHARGGLHVNTAPLTFGGIDYSPAQYRIVTWDGSAVTLDTHRVSSDDPPDVRSDTPVWTAQLAGRALRNAPVAAGELVLATSGLDDDPKGFVEAFDSKSGEQRWLVELASAVKSAACATDDLAIATAVTGETVCIDITTGDVRWRVDIDDPLRLWAYLRPATDGRRVFVGDTARFVALDVATGDVVWSRDDLGVRGNITCNAHPVVVGYVLIVSFAAQVPDMWALDAMTGEVRWPVDIPAGSVYDLDVSARMQHLPRVPMSAFGADPLEEDVYVVRLNNAVERIRVADGTIVWSSAVGGWANPAAPVIDGDDVFVCGGPGTVWCLSRNDGTVRWSVEVTNRSPFHMGPYRNTGGSLFGEAAVTRRGVVVACGDGRVVVLSREDGSILDEWSLGEPVAAAVAISGPRVYVVSIDGTLACVELS